MNQDLGIKIGSTKAKVFSPNHHAYVVEGEKIKEELLKMLVESWKIETKGNPDFSYQKFESLGIDEARAIKTSHENKSFSNDEKKIFIIEADSITNEAQNSLLKMLEDPVVNTYFFILGNCAKNLIPTLRSRLATLKIGEVSPEIESGEAGRAFLTLTIPKRLEFIKKLSDDIKNDKKTKLDAIILLNKIEQVIYNKSKENSLLPNKLLVNIETSRNYLNDPSANIKMIMEYIALLTPKA